MTEDPNDDAGATVSDHHAATVLVDNHRAFLRYLERRGGDRALAEDLLQEAFVRTFDRLAQTLKPEHAEALKAVDIDETPVKAFAAAARRDPLERRRPRAPGPSGAEATGGRLVRDLRRARLCRLFLRKALVAASA